MYKCNAGTEMHVFMLEIVWFCWVLRTNVMLELKCMCSCLKLCDYIVMRTLAEFNDIRDPKINLTQVCWELNELITMEDLLQGNKTINQFDHNAYT
jgi:hypothetical protein